METRKNKSILGTSRGRRNNKRKKREEKLLTAFIRTSEC
jgi:hypothetical protein